MNSTRQNDSLTNREDARQSKLLGAILVQTNPFTETVQINIVSYPEDALFTF